MLKSIFLVKAPCGKKHPQKEAIFSPFFGPRKSLSIGCEIIPHVETLIFQKFQLEAVRRFGDTGHESLSFSHAFKSHTPYKKSGKYFTCNIRFSVYFILLITNMLSELPPNPSVFRKMLKIFRKLRKLKGFEERSYLHM